MLNSMRVLALIPARGGSKGIKDKNIIPLNGKPLIAYTIEAAKKCDLIDAILVTTDSGTIARISTQYGARTPFLRPKELAEDRSKTVDAVVHAINWLKNNGEQFDVLILLQPTQPLRTESDITGALELFLNTGCGSVAGICEISDPPVFMRKRTASGFLEKYLPASSTVRRQDMEKLYRVNGAVYVNLIKKINETTSFNDNEFGYVMTRESSIDIDEPNDLIVAEAFLKRRCGRKCGE